MELLLGLLRFVAEITSALAVQAWSYFNDK
jgi:hypothetical protein